MGKYYTRACNFYYGSQSKKKVKTKQSVPLNGNKSISFDEIEIITRNSIKRIKIKNINILNKILRKKVKRDIQLIKKKKYFKNINLKNIPIIMGILNLTPDSFSDGGKFNKKNKGFIQANKLISSGCSIIDIGGESTRPGSKGINENVEWKRIKSTLKKIKNKKIVLSLDTRKSAIMLKGIKNNIKLINDVSGLSFDNNTLSFLKKHKVPFVLNHSQGTPETMQKNPKYKNVLLDVYDYFEKKISQIRKFGISHHNIILDPGIGFGKNLKHNITLISNVSIFHTLGFPIMLGASKKRFIKDIATKNDSKSRTGGTVSTSIYALLQGVQILRVHDVNEINQSIETFKILNFK
tara:strand:+ start:20515 stop:21567 length:1053 start_codon:yes stop_codon:yes gene_type:complete